MMNLAEYRHANSRLADFLPWAALVDEGIILNKDGSFQRTARFRGPDLDSAVPAELVAIAGRLNNALRRLGSGWAIFVEAQRHSAGAYPPNTFPDAASALVDTERRAQFEEAGRHFESSYYLTLLYLPPAEGAAMAERLLYEGSNRTASADAREMLAGFIDRTSRVLYDSQVAFGQSRVLLVWTRLIMPNGRSIVLERQQGADAGGYSGLEDEVDNHWAELFKAALLSTILGVGAELGSGTDSGGNIDIIQALRLSAANSLNQTGQKVVQRNLNIQPTLTIRPGFPVRVIVNRDMVLEPYRG
jgi:hypothetical protein